MEMIKRIMDLFKSEPELPEYGILDLEFHTKEYEGHLKSLVEQLHEVVTRRRWHLMANDPDDEVRPSLLIAKIEWTYSETIRSWLDREFIPKVRKYTPPDRMRAASDAYARLPIAVRAGDPLAMSEGHLEATRHHANKLRDVLHCMLCDYPVQWAKSLDGEENPTEVSRWYCDAKRIVERTFDKIDNCASTVIAFAKRNIK